MRLRIKRQLALLFALTLVLVPALGTTAAASPTITEYSTVSHPFEITTGPDGNLWFTNEVTDSIYRVTTSGTFSQYVLPSIPRPFGITTGSDGALWFTMIAPNSVTPGMIGRITTSGSITEYSFAGTSWRSPTFITSGSDGALWFTADTNSSASGEIGRITTSGTITEFSYSSSYPSLSGITSGSDGALWFAENAGDTQSTGGAIGRITTSGTITRFPTPHTPGSNVGPYGITSGPDGALWYTNTSTHKIGTITTSGTITEYSVPESTVNQIASGPDGALWFTDQGGNKIGRVTVTGVGVEYTVPTSSSSPYGITVGPDGAIWFTEESGNKIGRITTPQPSPQPAYYTKNDGTNFSRSTSPFESGVATQIVNADGSVTVSVNSAPGYADSGYVLYEGTLGSLPDFTVNGTGSNFGLNLWFDTSNNNEYFAWDSNGVLTSLDSDTYGLGPTSSSGALAVNGSAQFYMMSDGQSHSLSDLKNGLVSGISSSTKVAIWIGVDVGSGGSTSATINSISGL
jgi:virginiamycin B lyase